MLIGAGARGETPKHIDPALWPGWESMTVDQLWRELNSPRRRPTPQVTVEAILYSVRDRGITALKEPDNIERLSRCDDAARKQINQRIAKMRLR
jgi:hypothetical protein